MTYSWRQAHGVLTSLPSSFALYGALHSAALAASLRATQPVKKALFIAVAAGLSMSTVMLTLYGSRILRVGIGGWRPALLVALSAGLGAASYAFLIRCFWMDRWSPWSAALVALGCVAATWVASATGRFLPVPSGLWITVAWWCAFSAGLRCCSARMIWHGPASFVRANPLR